MDRVVRWPADTVSGNGPNGNNVVQRMIKAC